MIILHENINLFVSYIIVQRVKKLHNDEETEFCTLLILSLPHNLCQFDEYIFYYFPGFTNKA